MSTEQRVTNILREVVMRCHLALPLDELDEQWYNEGIDVAYSGNLMNKVYEILSISAEEAESTPYDEEAQFIKDHVKFSNKTLYAGGQVAGWPPSRVVAECEPLDLYIEFGYEKSQFKCREKMTDMILHLLRNLRSTQK